MGFQLFGTPFRENPRLRQRLGCSRSPFWERGPQYGVGPYRRQQLRVDFWVGFTEKQQRAQREREPDVVQGHNALSYSQISLPRLQAFT